MAKQIPNDEMQFAEDALIAQVQFAIHNMLEKKSISRAKLATLMGVSEPYVSQLFKDNTRNLTLKTIARIFRAVEEEPRITSHLLDELMPASVGCDSFMISKMHSKVDWIALMINEARRSQVEYHEECNDNEAALVA